VDRITLVRQIGTEVYEGCNDTRDCGIEHAECSRILNAGALLERRGRENDGYIT